MDNELVLNFYFALHSIVLLGCVATIFLMIRYDSGIMLVKSSILWRLPSLPLFAISVIFIGVAIHSRIYGYYQFGFTLNTVTSGLVAICVLRYCKRRRMEFKEFNQVMQAAQTFVKERKLTVKNLANSGVENGIAMGAIASKNSQEARRVFEERLYTTMMKYSKEAAAVKGKFDEYSAFIDTNDDIIKFIIQYLREDMEEIINQSMQETMREILEMYGKRK